MMVGFLRPKFLIQSSQELVKYLDSRRYRRSLNHKLCRLGIGRCYFLTRSAPYEKSKFLGSGGSMVARLKLKEIDGRAPPGVNIVTLHIAVVSAPESGLYRLGV